MRPVLKFPEADIAVVSFLLHFVWEFWQMPWYSGMAEVTHLEGVLICSRATFGDVVIALVAYVGVARTLHDRYWADSLTFGRLAAFLGLGLLITVLLEWLATEVFLRWSYQDEMLRLPIVGTGLAPLLQWIVIPTLVLIVVRRMWRSA